LLALLPPGTASAQGINQWIPIPDRPKQDYTAIQRGFQAFQTERPVLLPQVRQGAADSLPPFLRDSVLDIDFRTYYRDRITTSGQTVSVQEALATGGSLGWQSGKLFDLVSGGVSVYGSLPIYAPSDYGPSGLLLPDQKGFFVVGELYGSLHLPYDLAFTAGRRVWTTPFLGPQDNRMAPNTFYGYSLIGTWEDKASGAQVRYGGGYAATMKPRDSIDFISTARVAGADVDRGTGVAGAVLTWGPATVGVFEYFTQDVLNILYAEGVYEAMLAPHIEATVAMQFADQRSTGSNALTGSYFSTNQAGIRVQAGPDPLTLSAAFTRVEQGAPIQHPWSNNPFYTDSLLLSFQRAGEAAVLGAVSYNLRDLGLPSISARAQFVDGWTSAALVGLPLHESEWDFVVDWRPAQFAPGVWLRLTYGASHVWMGSATAYGEEARAILNYRFHLY
jgi:outer membrane porin, OprD family